MTPEDWRLVTAVFHDALARDPSARRAFLDDACEGRHAARAEIDWLLAAHDHAGAFGDAPLPFPPSAPDPAGAHDVPGDKPAIGTRPRPPRRHPFRLVLWPAAAAVAAAFAYAGWLIVASGGVATSLGWLERPQAGGDYVAAVRADGPAAGRLKTGDRIVSVNGLPPLANAGTLLVLRSLDVGDTYRMTVERDGRHLSFRLTAVPGPNVLPEVLTYFTVALVWCAIGFFIGFARPDTVLPRLAWAAAVSTGLVFLEVGVIQSGPLWQPLHMVLGFHFFARFPTGRPTTGWWKRSLVLLYATAGMPAVLGLWGRGALLVGGPAAAVHVATSHATLFALRWPLASLAGAAAAVAMAIVVPVRYRALTDEDHRRRVRWVFYGAAPALALQIWWAVVNLFDVFVGPAPVPRLDLTANALTVTIPISVAYAVVRHHVFDIKVVVRRTVQYLFAKRVLQVGIAVPMLALAVIVVTHRSLTIDQLAHQSQAYLYWLAATVVALRFRRPIRQALDRRFFREEHDREQLLVSMLDEVGTVESLSELSRLVNDRMVSVLHPTRAHVWYRDPEDLAIASSSDPLVTPPDVPSDARWLAWLEARGRPVELPLPADAGLPPDDARWFTDREISLIVPITDSGDRLVGALLLGAKKSEQPYDAADRRLLGAIARQAAVVRETLHLRARVGDELRVRHDVLAKLDGRLPNLLKECPSCGACFDGVVERCEHDGHALTLSLPVARTLDGRYRLERLLGKGGMGAVYEASDLRLRRTVAVKVMLGRGFGRATALRRFRREARAAAQLNHPNVVAVHDVGSLEGEGAYLVMERVRGVTLREELRRVRVMAPRVAAAWLGPVLDGLGAAHAAGVIHRDLKPENVMGRRDGSGALLVKILDLGLAKLRAEAPAASGTMTATGILMGTLAYMSPEQLTGRDVDERTDLFAVGVMLLEALTGRNPFAERDYARPADVAWRLPGASAEVHALEALLRRCLAPDPRERFPTAEATREALAPALLGCPPLVTG